MKSTNINLEVPEFEGKCTDGCFPHGRNHPSLKAIKPAVTCQDTVGSIDHAEVGWSVWVVQLGVFLFFVCFLCDVLRILPWYSSPLNSASFKGNVFFPSIEESQDKCGDPKSGERLNVRSSGSIVFLRNFLPFLVLGELANFLGNIHIDTSHGCV